MESLFVFLKEVLFWVLLVFHRLFLRLLFFSFCLMCLIFVGFVAFSRTCY